MKETTIFRRWVLRTVPRRRLVCHFYINKAEKSYHDKIDYAFLNLYSRSKDWVVKGTAGHGITSRGGQPSRVACLNCFEINDDFIRALGDLNKSGRHNFDFGVIFNKRYLRRYFGCDKVIDVDARIPNPRPLPNKCHCFDHPKSKYGVLKPFHNCKVVRVEIMNSSLRNMPIAAIPGKAVLGFIVRKEDAFIVKELLAKKRMGDVHIFPML